MTDAGMIDLDWHAMGTDIIDGHTTDADLADADVMDTNMMDSDADAMDLDDNMTDAGLTDGNIMDTRVMELGTSTMDLDTGTMDSDTGVMDSDTGMMDLDTDMTDLDAGMINSDANIVEADMVDADADATASAIIINQFPFGHPGAPIVHQASTPNRSSSMNSEWSLFCSQINWEVAWWAKTCGIISSAVGELLAIPGVSSPLIQLNASLIHRPRLLMHSDFYTELQNN
jgi:hypothetical protein